MLRIKKLHIDCIGSILNLQLTFNEKMNIICGMNGTGKTTILNCIAQTYSLHLTNLQKKADRSEGKWVVNYFWNNQSLSQTKIITGDSPQKNYFVTSGSSIQGRDELFIFQTHRNIPYIKIDSIKTGNFQTHSDREQQLITGAISKNLKQWFIDRFLWSVHPDKLSIAE